MPVAGICCPTIHLPPVIHWFCLRRIISHHHHHYPAFMLGCVLLQLRVQFSQDAKRQIFSDCIIVTTITCCMYCMYLDLIHQVSLGRDIGTIYGLATSVYFSIFKEAKNVPLMFVSGWQKGERHHKRFMQDDECISDVPVLNVLEAHRSISILASMLVCDVFHVSYTRG